MTTFLQGPLRALAFLGLMAVLVVSTPIIASAQTGSVSGVVTDADDGGPLAGANIRVMSANGTLMTGGATDIDGRYMISGIPAGSHPLSASFVGYEVQDATVSIVAGQTATVDFALRAGGNSLSTVIVTAGRRPEKALDAPASISVLTAADVAADIGTSSVEALRNTPGIDMAQTGVDRREVVLRGFNNAFSGATYVLTDYRQAAVPSLAVNIYSIMPNIGIDVDRIEVVRGPGSALYGAGVDAGVVHFITKGPFEHPGTTISVSGGERSYMGVDFRHAGVISPKFGYKFTGTYGQADDWEMDPNDPTDAIQLAGDVEPRRTEYDKLNLNGNLEFRPNDNTSIIANFGTSKLTATVLSGIGTLQAVDFGYSYGQLRLTRGSFFAQAYLNKNNAGESFVYDQDFNSDGKADPVTDNGYQLNLQAQYDYAAGARQNVIFGLDADLTRPDTEGTILGRNEENDQINEYGAYVQSQTQVTSQLDLVLAIRGDYNDVQEKTRISPRAALVFKPFTNQSFRATFNQAFSSPGTNSNFLDIVAATSPLIARGRGSATGFTWVRDPANLTAGAAFDYTASSLLPTSLGQDIPVGADLAEMYGLVYAGLAATPTPTLVAVLAANGVTVDAATAAGLVQALNPAVTTVSGFSQGAMAKLNLTTGEIAEFVDVLEDVKPLGQTTTQTYEVGYKGFIKNRLAITIDGYYTKKENFVGPLLLETPLVVTPTLAADLTTALATGISGNTPLVVGLAAALGVIPDPSVWPALSAAQQAAITSQISGQVAGLVVGYADDPNGGGGLPAAVGIVQPLQNNPGAGSAPELMLTYRNFGSLEYYGVDFSFDYFHSDALSFFGNVSWVSDDFFDNTELGEGNPDLELALNATPLKGRIGARYKSSMGFSANLALRYTDGFPIRSGPYSGDLPAYTVVDFGVGYDFQDKMEGLTFNLGLNNALNESHRQFIGAPLLGRMAIGRLTYSF